MGGCEVNTVRMAERAAADFLTVTELADTLVRREGVSFREAHHLVSAAVRELRGSYSVQAMIDAVAALAPLHIGRALGISREDLLEALDPHHFVAIRHLPGGPAPHAVAAALDLAEADLAETERWIVEKSAALVAYPVRIKSGYHELLEE
jgi:argininosuccinate lyase